MCVAARPPQAQWPPRGLGEDDAGVVQVQGAMTSAGTPTASASATPGSLRVPAGAQGELEAGRRGAGGGGGRGGGGGGGGEHGAMDGPGGVGGDVYRVWVWMWVGVVARALGGVGGEEAQGGEGGGGPRVVLSRVRGGEVEEGEGHLGRPAGAALTLGGLRGACRLGRALREGGGALREGGLLGGIGRGLAAVRLATGNTKRGALQGVAMETWSTTSTN